MDGLLFGAITGLLIAAIGLFLGVVRLERRVDELERKK